MEIFTLVSGERVECKARDYERYANGDEYDGEWIDEIQEGAGTYRYNNGRLRGSVYSGKFERGPIAWYRDDQVRKRGCLSRRLGKREKNRPWHFEERKWR